MQNCLQCNTEFKPKRNTALFCSNSCRVKYNIAHKASAPVMPQKAFIAPPLSGTGLSGNAAFDMYLADVKSELNLLRQRYEALKIKYNDLKDTHNDLKLEVATKERLSEADKAIESSKGLGGLVDKVTSNDRLMDILEGVVLAKFGKNDDELSDDVLEGVENRELFASFIQLIKNSDDVFVAKLLKITQYYIKYPNVLDMSINKITKNLPKTTTPNED